jgi:hypothetical protein
MATRVALAIQRERAHARLVEASKRFADHLGLDAAPLEQIDTNPRNPDEALNQQMTRMADLLEGALEKIGAAKATAKTSKASADADDDATDTPPEAPADDGDQDGDDETKPARRGRAKKADDEK